MNKFLIFIGGMVAGALLLYAIGFRTESSLKEQLRRELIETLSNNPGNLNQEAEVQYVEVKGKKGNVTLHTGMPKDSVKILVGKPDEVNLDEIGNIHFEKWGYKMTNKHGVPREYQMPDLNIDFKDGKLNGVRQE
ncbi:MAG: hypothetical protein E6H09_15460 [Bacteroidetes bacterium]|nr:MAG: hypothetical protein E6H09_15460 [Bacteroidota bacterium]